MAESYIEVTKDTFAEKVLSIPSDRIVIVNFSSDKSGACQIQDPEYDAVSKEVSKTYQERVLFAKTNVEGQGEFTQQWNVEGIPSLLFFKGGQEIYRITGIVMRERLRRLIEGVLLAN